MVVEELEEGEENDSIMQFAMKKHVLRTVGVMVWGAISYGSRSPLVFVRGNMAAVRYIKNIIRPSLLYSRASRSHFRTG